MLRLEVLAYPHQHQAKRLTRTIADEHKLGDEVFICSLSDDETIDSLLARILTDSDLDPALIPTVDWAAEVAEWHAQG